MAKALYLVRVVTVNVETVVIEADTENEAIAKAAMPPDLDVWRLRSIDYKYASIKDCRERLNGGHPLQCALEWDWHLKHAFTPPTEIRFADMKRVL